ncbi:hypothetical protein ZWY2020_047326 [Hordeum vulgare]|nr:hypothetical protein ZWY2020_047326 [Hordeum vulgare]
MLPFYLSRYGNPHSRTHLYGWESDAAVEEARASVARLIGADPREIFFTSGATECNNIAVKGVMHFYRDRRRHIITTQTEHKDFDEPHASMRESVRQSDTITGNQKVDVRFFWSWSYWSTFVLAWTHRDYEGFACWFPPMLGGSCILALFFPTHGTLLMTEERRPAIWAIYGTMGASSSSSLATMRLPHCSLHSVPRASKSLIIVAGEM